MKRSVFVVMLVLGCGNLSPDIEETQGEIVIPTGSRAAIGNVAWSPAPLSGQNQSSRANTTLVRRSGNRYRYHREDMTQSFLTCDIDMFQPSSSSSFIQQTGPARCTWAGNPWTIPATSTGPWRISFATAASGEPDAFELVRFGCCNAGATGPFAITTSSSLYPGVTLHSLPHKPLQQEAERVAWIEGYGMTFRVPELDFVEGARLDCASGNGFNVNVGGVLVCVGGWTFTDPFLIQMYWRDGLTFHESPLAHEFAHAYLFVTTGTADGGLDHQNSTGPIWGPGGKVEQVSALLAANGL